MRLRSRALVVLGALCAPLACNKQPDTARPSASRRTLRSAAGWRFNISLTGGDTPMPYTFDLSAGGLLK